MLYWDMIVTYDIVLTLSEIPHTLKYDCTLPLHPISCVTNSQSLKTGHLFTSSASRNAINVCHFRDTITIFNNFTALSKFDNMIVNMNYHDSPSS